MPISVKSTPLSDQNLYWDELRMYVRLFVLVSDGESSQLSTQSEKATFAFIFGHAISVNEFKEL